MSQQYGRRGNFNNPQGTQTGRIPSQQENKANEPKEEQQKQTEVNSVSSSVGEVVEERRPTKSLSEDELVGDSMSPEEKMSKVMIQLINDVANGAITLADARRNLHIFFRGLDQASQRYLYENRRAEQIALRVKQYGEALFQEIPLMLSQVKLD